MKLIWVNHCTTGKDGRCGVAKETSNGIFRVKFADGKIEEFLKDELIFYPEKRINNNNLIF